MTQDKAKAVVDFLNWAIHDGQQYSSDLLYVPLPDAVVKKNEQAISSIAFTGGAVPEFGPIASLILVVAITSVIALSAKGILGLRTKL
jgi:predicted secreted protein with PEFG-CTERM motif